MAKVTTVISETNLDKLPKRRAVYAIFAAEKETGKPINCRYVGETDNLQERTTTHFSKSESNNCLKEFMKSSKTKILVYELLPDSDKEERLGKENDWIEEYEPLCNKSPEED